MMRILKALALTMLLALAFGPAEAILSQSLDGADSLSIGTPFTLIIETDYAIRSVIVPDTLSDFRVLETKLSRDAGSGKAELSIIPLGIGPLSFPKLEVKPSSILLGSDFTDAFRVYVLSTRADSDTLLRDLKPLQKHAWQPPFWLYLLLLFSAVTLAIILIVNAFRHKTAKPSAPAPQKQDSPPPRPAWELALARLDDLIASKSWEQDLVHYHFELSAILREFLEATYRFNALEMTTREIAGALQKLRPAQAEEIIQLLQYTDAVKFAKASPSEADILSRSLALKLYLLQFVPTTGDTER